MNLRNRRQKADNQMTAFAQTLIQINSRNSATILSKALLNALSNLSRFHIKKQVINHKSFNRKEDHLRKSAQLNQKSLRMEQCFYKIGASI